MTAVGQLSIRAVWYLLLGSLLLEQCGSLVVSVQCWSSVVVRQLDSLVLEQCGIKELSSLVLSHWSIKALSNLILEKCGINQHRWAPYSLKR